MKLIDSVSGSDEHTGFQAGRGAGAAYRCTALYTSITGPHSLAFIGTDETRFSAHRACRLIKR
jgi:hypothetical protein